jgi:hypothetical protein
MQRLMSGFYCISCRRVPLRIDTNKTSPTWDTMFDWSMFIAY